MRCIKCNYDNLDGLQYCVNCGSPLITMEEKQNQEMEKQNILKKLYVLIGILVFVLVVMVVMLLLGVGFGKDEDTKKEADLTVDKEFIAVWNCNSDATLYNKKNYSLTIELNEDGTFRIGNYGQLDKDNTSGVFGTTSLGVKDTATKKYNLYTMTFMQKKKLVNGKESEEENTLNFNGGITDSLEEATFNNAKTGTTYFCSK